MIQIVRYSLEQENIWNNFLEKTKSSLFLFNRNYQDYHSEKFQDHSLVIFKENNVVAIFPANEKDQTIFSHQGLTFGGLLVCESLKTLEYKEVVSAVLKYYKDLKIKSIFYKAIPYPFTKSPSQEDLYFLYKAGAILVKRDLSSVIYLEARPKISKLRTRMVKKAVACDIKVIEMNDLQGFYNLLESVLVKFGIKPTHSLEELTRLKRKFDTKIRLFVALKDKDILAGTIIYDYQQVVHTQYLACSESGKKTGALDLVLEKVIEQFNSRKYFSFGISTEDGGRYLNEGLLNQKEGFGARSIVHDCYMITL